jgi:hypothetical protein
MSPRRTQNETLKLPAQLSYLDHNKIRTGVGRGKLIIRILQIIEAPFLKHSDISKRLDQQIGKM